MTKTISFALSAAILAATAATPASAAGCNGVVNPLIWGCAPWDNNNGPRFAYYVNPRTKQVTIPQQGAQTRFANGQRQVLFNGNWLQVSGTNGANIIASANIVGNAGAGIKPPN